jgi:microcystin-dependent protein
VSNPYLGEIRLFPYNFAPDGWAFCDGQTLAIASYTALFSLLGTTYGGNGTSTFQLPDLRGRVAISMGSGVGLSPYTLGEVGGAQSVQLELANMPEHSHTVNASADKGTLESPKGAVPGLNKKEKDYDAAPDGATTMNADMIGITGGTAPVAVIQPFLAMSYCIAMAGIFPSRN